MKQKKVLIFSGLDPTGGAGIQADIESLANLRVHACSIITALTVQDTHTVHRYINVDSQVIAAQARCLLNDIHFDCIKIGMLADPKTLSEILNIVTELPAMPLVIDPIHSSGEGAALTQTSIFEQLKNELIPHATIITPNSVEARKLVPSANTLEQCAQNLLASGCQSVLITGSHEDTLEVYNTLYIKDRLVTQNWPRLSNNYHGSGCTLSANIAGYLALGEDIETAVYKAQQSTYTSLLNAKKVGQGQLIPNRFYLPAKK